MPAGATYEPIATTTLGSANSTITFSSIPTSYTDLRLIVVSTPTASLQLKIRYNNDSTAIYSGAEIRADGASVGSDRYTGENSNYANWGYLWTANLGMVKFDVLNYLGSTFKTTLSTWDCDKNGTGNLERGVHLYRSTSAINRIDLVTSTSTMAAGTTATLYGIKAA